MVNVSLPAETNSGVEFKDDESTVVSETHDASILSLFMYPKKVNRLLCFASASQQLQSKQTGMVEGSRLTAP